MPKFLRTLQMLLYAAVLLFVQSCTELAIGALATSSVVFSRYDGTIFNSRLIRATKADVNAVLHKHKHPSSAVIIAQDGNSVYIIGAVKNTSVKSDILDAVSKKLGGAYIDEIAIEPKKRKTFQDFRLKTRLQNHLIFTRNLKSQNYQVFVYNQKAYIVGRTSGPPEKELLIKTLEGVLYVTDVVIYIT